MSKIAINTLTSRLEEEISKRTTSEIKTGQAEVAPFLLDIRGHTQFTDIWNKDPFVVVAQLKGTEPATATNYD